LPPVFLGHKMKDTGGRDRRHYSVRVVNLFRCARRHNGYNLNHKGGSMAKDKSPKKEVKKPKKKK